MRGAEGEARSDGDGAFRVTGLGGGPFVLSCEGGVDGEAASARLDGVQPGSSMVQLVLRAPLTLRGRVVDGSGRPLDVFTLTASRLVDGVLGEAASHSLKRTFATDDGQFEIDGLVAGTWRVDARAPEHVLVAPRVEHLPGAATDASIELVLQRSVRASGVVRDPDGDPVAGATVQVATGRSAAEQQLSKLPLPPHVSTDELGRFELGGLPPGDTSLVAMADGFTRGAAVAVSSESGAHVDGLVLTLARGGIVTGEVYDEQGRPVEGRMINLIRWQPGSVDSHVERSDADGRFRVEAVEPAAWTVIAIDTAADVSAERAGANAAAMLESMSVANVDVREGETTHVVFGEPPQNPVRVFGRVRQGGAPFGDAIIGFLREDDGTLASMVQTGIEADGRYELVVDGPGAYVVSVNPFPGRPGEQSVVPFACEIPERAEVEHDFEVPGGRISGRVMDARGRPVEARITLSTDGAVPFPGGRYVETRTSSDGSYELDALADGSYRIAAGGSLFQADARAPARVLRRGIEVQHGGHVDGVDFELPAAGSITLFVTDSADQPVEGAVVFLRAADGVPLETLATCATDAGGRAIYDGLADGTYTALVRTGERAGALQGPVRVRAGATVDVQLRLELASVLVVEVSRDGEVCSAHVSVTDEDGHELAALLGAEELQRLLTNGGLSRHEVRVGPLPPGRYQVRAELDGRVASKPVTLRGEPERKLKLRLR